MSSFNCDLLKSLHSQLLKGNNVSSLLRPLRSELTVLQEKTDNEIISKITAQGTVLLNGKSAQVNSEFIKFTDELSRILDINPYKAASIIHTATNQKARYGDLPLVSVAIFLYYTCREYQLECISLILSTPDHLKSSNEISNQWFSDGKDNLFNQILQRIDVSSYRFRFITQLLTGTLQVQVQIQVGGFIVYHDVNVLMP